MNELINNAFLRLTKRAEAADRNQLVATFVDTGPMLSLLGTRDHQVIFGRRGTGKTHALLYLADMQSKRGDIPVYIDMRTIGSTGGLYADSTIPLAERATRLLADTLGSIHEGLLTAAIDRDELNLSELGPRLDELGDAISEVVVKGPVEREASEESSAKVAAATSSGFGLGKDLQARLDSSNNTEAGAVATHRTRASGDLHHRVHFGAVGAALKKIAEAISPKRIWVLIDEWSVVPMELQPYLADLLRRSLLPAPRTTLKIGAIEQRAAFQLAGLGGDYVGIELGADMAADLNLDDFMVFDNDAALATQFFRDLIFKHYKSVEHDAGIPDGPTTAHQLLQMAFTQRNPFEELVRSAEGVPRDAINILGLSAQRARANLISVDHVRSAAKTWYARDKEAAASANARAKALLHWIVDEVIGHRRARAFLLQSGERNSLIDALFDARVLHLLKRNISSNENPGVRYDAYKIDYGCYVDLLTTHRAPQGTFTLDAPERGATHIDVPPDDYRAIRRAVLDLGKFESATSSSSSTA